MLRFWLRAAALVLCVGQVMIAVAQPLHFSATGCGPYSPEEEPLLAHYVDLVNHDSKSEFFVHLGDVVTGAKKQWPESQYAAVADILKKSRLPTFVVLGDNEWNDLDKPAEGLEFWNRHFRDFEQHFTKLAEVAAPGRALPSVVKQSVRPENFAFVSKGVLIIGLNLVGGRVHDPQEWAVRLRQDAQWVAEQISQHGDRVRAAVVLAQAKPTADHDGFFKPFVETCQAWTKPVLYLHADGHVWQEEKAWRAPNLWRVQTDQVKLNPPVLVTVTEDSKQPFVFDRRIDIGSRRELFVDNYLIDRLQGCELKLQRPSADQVVLVCDAPWEGNISAYYTIFADNDKFRMYYRGAHYDEVAKKSTHPEFACYAESLDGKVWHKPALGIVDYQGSTANNIILAGEGTHNFAPFIDRNPNCAPDAKYKALAGDRHGLKAYKSADGVHWSLMRDKPVITDGDFDSQNIAFWHPVQKRYLAYHRKGRNGVRDIMMSVSQDFLNWNDPRYLDYGAAPVEHLYTNAIQPYFRAPHLLVGFPTRFQPSHQQVEPVLMTSRDGLSFQRWQPELIPITAPQDRDGNRSNYMTYGLLQLPGQDRELSVYATEAYYAGPASRLRRFTYRMDGFVSVHAEKPAAELVTKAFTFDGAQLLLNFKTQAQGRLRVELQDADGRPIPGFTLAECQPMQGDAIEQTVTWSRTTPPGARTTTVSGFINRPIRLRVELTDADLYSFQFVP